MDEPNNPTPSKSTLCACDVKEKFNRGLPPAPP
jgi:hypothetical protein